MQHPFDAELVTDALKRTGLFDALSDGALDGLLTHCEIRLCPPGEVVLHEGQPGDALYVVLEGAVQVFRDLARGEVVLARLPKGGHVGEQALLPGGALRRTASVRAAAPTVLLRLPREPFLAVVAGTEGLAAELRDAGRAQLLKRVAEHGALARALTAEPDFGDAFSQVERSVGEKLIIEGAPADALYLITKGFAEVYRGEGKARVRLARLTPGQCVGELGLVHRKPRAASVVALSRLEALRIDGDWFTRRYAASPQLRAWIGTLESAYRLADRGFVTTHGGQWVGRDTLTSVYHLPDRRQVTVTQVVGEAVVDAQTASGAPDRTLVHEREGARRTLMLEGARLVGLDAIGPWPDLPAVMDRLLSGEAFTAKDAADFEATGTVPSARTVADPVLCRCLSVRHSAVRGAINGGCGTLKALKAKTGCGSVCAGCEPDLKAMLAGRGFAPAVLEPVAEHSDDVRTFFLGVEGGEALPAAPGQAVQVRAHIDGDPVRRTYLLTGWRDAGYEITVRRETDGVFSPWLFQQPPGTTLEVSPPSGDALAPTGACVALVAGVGANIALALARAVVEHTLPGPLTVHQSSRQAHAFEQALAELDAAGRLTLTRRTTAHEGRLNADDVQALVAAAPDDAQYVVCGPGDYNADVQAWLEAARVPAARISPVVFEQAAGPIDEDGSWVDQLADMAKGAWVRLLGR